MMDKPADEPGGGGGGENFPLDPATVSFIEYVKSTEAESNANAAEPQPFLRSTSIESELLQQEDIYVFVKFLGHGAFGRVNLYRNAKDNSLVVWKEINLKNSNAKSRTEAFSEVEILSMLDHPNIIAYFKHFISEDMLYIELEYAKGGNLANLIRQQKYREKYLEEETVLWYLLQLASAIAYIHDLGIMHRDIKALNIFIMQNGLLKLGDFGIAKVLEASDGLAESQVGTPFYMSPELIEGQKYSNKTDIWSLGCVAYELLTLEKVFDATNQLKLALKISKCEVDAESLKSIEAFSHELKELVTNILSKNPDLRPTAREIVNHPVFSTRREAFFAKIESLNSNKKFKYPSTLHTMAAAEFDSNGQLNANALNTTNASAAAMTTSNYHSIIASKLSEVYTFGGGKFLPKQVEFFKKEHAPLFATLGSSHFAVLTSEKELFTWGSPSHQGGADSCAKLGHGKAAGFTRIPKRVDAFNGMSVEQVACGDDFTCISSEDGDLYVFGTNYSGHLGLGDQEIDESNGNRRECIYLPTKIEFFSHNSLKVRRVACGDSHVIVLTEDNRVFSWGSGEYGQLGHGDEDDRTAPTEIKFNFKYAFKNVFAGPDCSFLLTREGRVLAFGNNEYNKLALNSIIGFKNANNQKNLNNSFNISQQLIPKLVKSLVTYNIQKVCPGKDHTAVIDYSGRLLTFGSNKFGQLGLGDLRPRVGVCLVNALIGHQVTNAACGDSFTICSTSESLLYSWGNKKEGRLGFDSSIEGSSSVTSTPKPIFGSLHIVSCINSRFWHSIIIAEQTLNTKPVRSVSYADYMRKGGGANSNSSTPAQLDSSAVSEIISPLKYNDLGKAASPVDPPKQPKPPKMEPIPQDDSDKARREEANEMKRDGGDEDSDEDSDDEDVPDWLRQAMNDGPYIPLEVLEKKEESLKNEKLRAENESKNQELESALKLIEDLKRENDILRLENLSLKNQLISLESKEDGSGSA